jgi:hypothetical protein
MKPINMNRIIQAILLLLLPICAAHADPLLPTTSVGSIELAKGIRTTPALSTSISTTTTTATATTQMTIDGITYNLPSSASFGGSDGGGGTFVQSANSKLLVFWDLYLNNPSFSDQTPGDVLGKTVTGKWIDYRKFQSYRLMQERLKKWQSRAPNLVKLITDDGIMLRDGSENEPEGFYFLLVATKLYIQKIEEIYVPSNMDTKHIRALPGAYFIPESETILLSTPVWNNSDRTSQAAMLLHERMRSVQIDYNVSNEQLQRTVYVIMTQDPDSVPEEVYNDNWFSTKNFNPKLIKTDTTIFDYADQFGYGSLYGRVLYEQAADLARYQVEIGLDCMKDSKPRACMQKEYFAKFSGEESVKALEKKTGGDLTNANAEVAMAVRDGVLGKKYVSDQVLKSTGKNNEAFSEKMIPISSTAEVLLDPSTCNQVRVDHLDPTYTNTYRQPLYCGQNGWLEGSGALVFETPMADELNVEVKARLYTHDDGGSEIFVEMLGIPVDIHVEGQSYLVLDMGEESSSIDLDDSQNLHAFVFRFMWKEKKIEIVLNDNGQFRTNAPLISWTLKKDMRKNRSKMTWRYGTANLSSVERIRLLGDSDGMSNGEAVVGPFENWDATNKDGSTYISKPGENCIFGFQSEYHDAASNRDQCLPVYNYQTKPEEECGPGYVSTWLDSNTKIRSCISLKDRDSYEPEQGQKCIKGFISTGIYQDRMGCADVTKTNLYILYPPEHMKPCAKGFKAEDHFDSNVPYRSCSHK